jgi:ADP-ribose pyrophosphatase YjhB (NUDIX family)
VITETGIPGDGRKGAFRSNFFPRLGPRVSPSNAQPAGAVIFSRGGRVKYYRALWISFARRDLRPALRQRSRRVRRDCLRGAIRALVLDQLPQMHNRGSASARRAGRDKWLEFLSLPVVRCQPDRQLLGKKMEPAWLVWARELQAIAQTGLAFTTGTYDRERYTAIRSVAARIMAAYSDADSAYVEALFAKEKGYATPKVDVRGAVIEDGRILLVREIEDSGRWTIPGGWADVNQSPSESVIREVREESGFEVKVRKLAALYDRARHGHPPHPFNVYRLFFICDVIGGAPKPGLETSAVGFFGEDEIPKDLSPARVLPHQIRRMFEHSRERYLPTDFD